MTSNQINYLKHREDVRHNLATEKELVRANLAQENWRENTLRETIRSNKANELVRQGTLDEQRRHNYAADYNANSVLLEAQRANKARESNDRLSTWSRMKNDFRNYVELARSNRVNERERERSNRQTEWNSRLRDEEQERHNRMSETQNSFIVSETQRHNKVQEDIANKNVGLGYANVSLGYSQLGELSRSNQAREAETQRANQAREQETERHNRRDESINQMRATSDYLRTEGLNADLKSKEFGNKLNWINPVVMGAGFVGGTLFGKGVGK